MKLKHYPPYKVGDIIEDWDGDICEVLDITEHDLYVRVIKNVSKRIADSSHWFISIPNAHDTCRRVHEDL